MSTAHHSGETGGHPAADGATIGVFDSGFGGLTVLRSLLRLMPGARYVYLGDTARLPYGSKSQATIARYAVEAARFLQSRGASHLVIACNTATALALPEIQAAVAVPVYGVVEPGARAALAALQRRATDAGAAIVQPVLVLATAATVASHAYRDACAAVGLQAVEKACPLLVPLIEEGWTDHPVTRQVIRIYLAEALAECQPCAVILGCTHYPLIAEAIRGALVELGHNIPVIDSAAATAATVAQALGQGAAGRSAADTEGPISGTLSVAYYATDSVEKFRKLGSSFLGSPLPAVDLLDLGG